jgi:NAD(P)-dependent dehydrogenase (short-subunit alcohol dehydrogenase family)
MQRAGRASVCRMGAALAPHAATTLASHSSSPCSIIAVELRADGGIVVPLLKRIPLAGRAIALAFRRAGALVAVGGRPAERNANVLASLGPSAAAFELDVADEGSVERALAGTVERFGRIDILVNNAGVGQRASVMELDRATWQHVIDTNLTGPFLCTKHAARHMKTQGAGKIINISSIYGVIAPSKGLQVAYTVAKHG